MSEATDPASSSEESAAAEPEDGGESAGSKPAERRPRGLARLLFLGIDLTLATVAVMVTLWVAQDVIKSRPRPKRKKPERRATLVEVQTVETTTRRVRIEGSGLVAPSRQVAVRPQVTGRIKERSPALEVGSFIARGDTLVVIEDNDYVIALRRARAELIQAQAALKLEKGSGRLAKREYTILGSDPKADTELVLRKPQLASAKALASAAGAAVAKARLDLKRTTIDAPFDAVVRSRTADLGSQVTPASDLVTLAGTDLWWVEVRLPSEQLRWLETGDSRGKGGSLARLSNPAGWGPEASRTGRVARIAPDVEEGGRMARVLIAVEDPLGRGDKGAGKPPLKIGEYLQVMFEGRKLDQVVSLPRELLRDGDTVWVMNGKDQLAIIKVELAYAGRDTLLVSKGLGSGDRVVASPLSSPVAGMDLRVKTDGDPGRAKAAQGPPGEGRPKRVTQ